MKTLTVFTPTYNRAFCLGQVYDSLCRQTSQDFLWLIIDDGSTDTTKELVNSWIAENKIAIQYHFKENGGMHTGHNAAYSLIETEYNVCIDSDDFMPDNAVAIIVAEVQNLPANFAGIVGLDADKQGNIVGTKIPDDIDACKLYDLYENKGVTGDKKLVYKTAIVKKYPPYPEFKGEKLVPLGYLYLLIDQDYVLKPVNEVFCIVEYLLDGSSKNMLRQYRRNPNGFVFSRVSRINLGTSIQSKFKNSIHLISSAIFAKSMRGLSKSKSPILLILATPFGILLNLYIRMRT